MELHLLNPQYITKIPLHLPKRRGQTVKPQTLHTNTKSARNLKKGPGAPLTTNHQHISGHGIA